MTWRVLAAGVPLLLVVYLAVTDFVDLRPFNDIRAIPVRLRLAAAAVNYPILLLGGLAMIPGTLVANVPGLVLVGAAAVGNALSWWVPYLTGRRPTRADEYHQDTRRSLPRIGDHPVPDDQHVVVSVLIWLALVAGLVVLVTRP